MKKLFSTALFWPSLALVLLLVFNLILHPSFFKITVQHHQLYGSLIDIAFRSAPLLLVALGMTFVIATRGIDLSVGAIAALAASVSAAVLAQGLPFSIALLLALLAGSCAGLINSFLIVTLRVQPIISSLIAMVVGRGLAQLLVGGQIIPLTNSSFLFLGNSALLGLPFGIWLALFILIAILSLARKTALGLFIEAFGSSPQAAFYAGLSTSALQTFAYVLSGLLAAISGLLMSSNIRAVDANNLGLYLELDAILAVVIGGTRLTGGRFSLFGTVLGALIIQTVSTTINTQGIAVETMLIVKATVVIVICLLQSNSFTSLWKLKSA
jgi:simple sugar transport system permease protein